MPKEMQHTTFQKRNISRAITCQWIQPETPADGASYGFGLNGAPIENIIHTVNGQYNPTIDAKVGEWNLFGFPSQSIHIM